eukprot:1159254-Pelagomonas_calceolata.AAC.3
MDYNPPPQASKRRAILQDHGVALPQHVQPIPQQVALQFPAYPISPPQAEPDRAARPSSAPRKRDNELLPPVPARPSVATSLLLQFPSLM